MDFRFTKKLYNTQALKIYKLFLAGDELNEPGASGSHPNLLDWQVHRSARISAETLQKY